MNYENKISSQGIRYSRYIASYAKIASEFGWTHYGFWGLYHWLISIGLPKEEAREIARFGDCGKMELESNLREWFKNKPKYKRPKRA